MITPQSKNEVALSACLQIAERFIGDRERAMGWMNTPNFALGGATPLIALESEGGREHILRVLGVIAYGGVV